VALLIEQYEGKFPLWLAPEQVRVLPITDRHVGPARAVKAQLAAAGLRVTVDESNDRISYKVRQAQLEQVPYMVVIGDREVASGSIAIRSRSAGDLGSMTVADFVARLQREIAEKI
ncbi:MAG: threonine--tRNA ligase, partial [Firmicutes bacterium]|nr:threonine--tRNA ligase [Bacillota bacterium]